MTTSTPADSGEYERLQSWLASTNLALQRIARLAPLAETLAGIVTSVERQHPEIAGAILLLDQDGDYLRLGAASGREPEYRRLLEAIMHGAEGMDLVADPAIRTGAGQLEASRFWHRFRTLASQHGLQACSATPLLSAADRPLGIFVAYAKTPAQASDRHRPAIEAAAPLASLAIERSLDMARIAKAEQTLRESETIMALAIESSGTGVWDRDLRTDQIDYSAGWKAILGYSATELTNRIEDSYQRVHPDDLAFVQAAIQDHLDQKTPSYQVEHRIRCKDGSYKWISSRGKVVSRDHAGQPLRMIGTTTDITALRSLSERLQRSVDLITSLTDEVPGLVFQYRQLPGRSGYFSYVSKGIQDIYELTPEQASANVTAVHSLIHPEDFESYHASLVASAATLTPWHLEYRVMLPRQGLRWRRGDAQPRRLADGSTLWHGFITDVTDRKRAELELHEFATIDFLTQLPNRRCFMACMEGILARVHSAPATRMVALMCDLDHFKTINDNYGHAVGDRVLQHFAAILRDGLRKNDTVSRIGGEEFAVVLPDTGLAEATIFAKRVQARLAATPLVEDGNAIFVTVSIGIALIHATDANVGDALSRSDLALYRAKTGGRNRIEVAAE